MTIPPGLVDGQMLRLRGKGAPGTGKGPRGCLDRGGGATRPPLRREGDDIAWNCRSRCPKPCSAAGTRSTPAGDVTMTVPKGSNTGTNMRLKGKGAPRRGGGHGDQFVKLRVVLPEPPDPELEDFVSSWDTGKAFNPREEVMIMNKQEFLTSAGLEVQTLEIWLDQRWLIPEQTSAEMTFSETDVRGRILSAISRAISESTMRASTSFFTSSTSSTACAARLSNCAGIIKEFSR